MSMRPIRALIVLSVVVVVLGVVVAGLWWFDHRNSQTEAARIAAPQTAREQVVTVLSYDFRSIEEDLQRARGALTEQYGAQFVAEANKITVPAAGAQSMITHADVVASSVVRADPDEVVVLVFLNQRTHSSQAEAVQLSAHRVVLTMTRFEDRWLISDLERV